MPTQTKTKTSTAVKIALITIAVGSVLAAGAIANKTIKKNSKSASSSSDTRCVAKPAGNTCSDTSGQLWCTTDCKGGTYAGTYCCVGTCCVPLALKDGKKCPNGSFVPKKTGCCSNEDCGSKNNLGTCVNGNCSCKASVSGPCNNAGVVTQCNECCDDKQCKDDKICVKGKCSAAEDLECDKYDSKNNCIKCATAYDYELCPVKNGKGGIGMCTVKTFGDSSSCCCNQPGKFCDKSGNCLKICLQTAKKNGLTICTRCNDGYKLCTICSIGKNFGASFCIKNNESCKNQKGGNVVDGGSCLLNK
ncbi:MAG: hypothetical protein NTZ97_01630 [Candidatus Moranbacteria bacterium]|nr:hypothetical protein [Candidatus Moranbacteria bacterium]